MMNSLNCGFTLFGIALWLNLYLCIPVLFCGCGPYVTIPVKSRFVDNIWFSGNLHNLGGKLKDRQHPYVMVEWKASGQPAEQTIPPFGVEFNGKRFEPEDFLFKSFSKRGTLDSRIESSKISGVPVDPNFPAILTIIDDSANTHLRCRYIKNQMLESIELLILNKGDGINPPNLPQKEIKIITSKGTVILPANYGTLVKTLGEPLEHIPEHLYKPDHIL